MPTYYRVRRNTMTHTVPIKVTDSESGPYDFEKQFTTSITARPSGVSLDEWDEIAWFVKEYADENLNVDDFEVSEFTQLDATVEDGEVIEISERYPDR